MKALQVDREAHDGPLAARLGLAAQTEAAETEDGFDPAEHRFDDRLPTSIAGTPHLAGHAGRHALGGLMGGFGEGPGLPSRPSEIYPVIWRVSSV